MQSGSQWRQPFGFGVGGIALPGALRDADERSRQSERARRPRGPAPAARRKPRAACSERTKPLARRNALYLSAKPTDAAIFLGHRSPGHAAEAQIGQRVAERGELPVEQCRRSLALPGDRSDCRSDSRRGRWPPVRRLSGVDSLQPLGEPVDLPEYFISWAACHWDRQRRYWRSKYPVGRP